MTEEAVNDRRRLAALEERIADLERQLAEVRLENDLLRTRILLSMSAANNERD